MGRVVSSAAALTGGVRYESQGSRTGRGRWAQPHRFPPKGWSPRGLWVAGASACWYPACMWTATDEFISHLLQAYDKTQQDIEDLRVQFQDKITNTHTHAEVDVVERWFNDTLAAIKARHTRRIEKVNDEYNRSD